MFELKKYKIVKSFNGYQVGALVGFNGADAEKYAHFIEGTEKVAPVEIKATPVVEVKEEQPKRKYVRKGKK